MRDLLLSPCLAAVLLLVLLSGITAPLQAAVTGDLQVEVHDVDNGPLPGATVTIESTAQPGQRVATSQGKGEARFNMLAPGLYSVRVSMPNRSVTWKR